MNYRLANLTGSVAFFTALGISAHAQGTFQNLNFEEANPIIIVGSPYYPNAVTAASALPDWTVSYGNVQQTQITENDPSLGSTWVNLAGVGYGAIDGNYSAEIQGGITASAASISQTGLIPASSQSLTFEGVGVGPLDVFIGTQSVPFAAIGSGPNYTLYGANISAWADQTEQLTFAQPEGSSAWGWRIDDISFSTMAVPEPSPFILTGIGGLLFALYRRFAPNRH